MKIINIKNAWLDFLAKALILYSLTVILWFLDYLFINSSHSVESLFDWKLVGLVNDLKLVSLILIIYLPLQILFFLIKPILAKIAAGLLFTLYFLFAFALSIYFKIALIPLRVENMNGMSTDQAADIIAVYGFSKWQLLFVLPIAIIIFFVVLKFKKISTKWLQYIMLGVLAAGALLNLSPSSNYDSDLENDIKVNKVLYFLDSFLTYQKELQPFSDQEIQNELKTYYELNDLKNKSNFDYPFFMEKQSENYLGNYFVKRDTQPNIVFIIAESLGKQFSGDNSRLGSFTPFLDSLANQGLYWENCLSNAERTFGAIPNLMSGLPEGDQGFLNLRSAYPDHLSLPLLLKNSEGYQTNFFCGAKASFDYMDEYLMFQKFDGIYGKVAFSENKVMSNLEFEDGHQEEFNWGAEDKIVFSESMDMFQESPFFNLYLTTSFHGPFAYSNQDRFIQIATNRIKELKPKIPENYSSEIETFAALMYMDESIKGVFEQYKKRSDFENTIFVIVGDHSIKFMSENSRLEKYQVPLIIYSPLLKGKGYFKNVVSHKDVPSALQALLRDNFSLALPSFSISQTNNLKTTKDFFCNVNSPLMYADKRLENYLYKNWFLSEGQLFQLIQENGTVKLEKSTKGLTLEEMLERLANYKYLSIYTAYQNKYLPKAEHEKWNRKDYIYQVDDSFDNPYIGSSLHDIYRNTLTKSYFYSDSFSISNAAKPYLKLFEKIPLSNTADKRLRVKLKFKIYSESSDLPSIYLTHFLMNGESYFDLLHLTADYGSLRSLNEGWQEFQCSFWLNKDRDSSIKEDLSIHLHQPTKTTFYIDDLILEIQRF